MLLMVALSLVILKGDAHSLPLLPASDSCLENFVNLFKCHQLPSLDDYIYSFAANGTMLDLTDVHNAFRTSVDKDIVKDICSYFEGVSTCLQNSYTYLQSHCPSKMVKIAESFIRLTSALCDLYEADINMMVQCSNQDNSILVTYVSCMEGAYKYLSQHTIHQCSIVQRFRDCLYQFDTCSEIHTFRLMTMFDEYKDDVCFILKELKN
ncbi:uncharacterized protein LOC127708178 isoform X1 [Mytilus californianus]|uniref:uncharacterized protein LOC127708178 isoform X1 n=1 Tax=Mytilus californianus TaxID=6549 RepID=UPI0022480E3A|nr:uncharacterized protein LOC127708178 isoform X1 [Mytilus californianus]